MSWCIVDAAGQVWRAPGATQRECEDTATLWRSHGIACRVREPIPGRSEGGYKRAANLTAERRSEIASKAARVRWDQ